MFTIKKVLQSDEHQCGKKTELLQAERVTVVYHCDPSFSHYFKDFEPTNVAAIVIADTESILVEGNETLYVVNENGKTVQTV